MVTVVDRYCRVSTNQPETSLSLEQQVATCQTDAEKQGLVVAAIYQEQPMERHPAFIQGYREAVQWLEAWQEHGFESMAAAASEMQPQATEELANLQEERFAHWKPRQANREMWQGWLAALDGYQQWRNRFSSQP